MATAPLQEIFDVIQRAIYKYEKFDFGYPQTKPDTYKGDSFNIMTVIQGIRVAMLYQPVEYQAADEAPPIFKAKAVQLQQELDNIFKRYELKIQLIPDYDGFYVVSQQVVSHFHSLKDKTHILGLYDRSGRTMQCRIYYDSQMFYCNTCDHTFTIQSLTLLYEMFKQMKTLATILRGSVTMKMLF